MKRIIPILFVLLLAIPSFAAEHAESGADASLRVEKAFPAISRSQDRRPVMKIATEDDVICGYNPEFPHCDFKCNNGVPILNPDGSQRIICWQEPVYPEYPGGGCSRYYACVTQTASACSWSGNPYQGCTFQAPNSCSSCDWF
jgi:hypothetical protein